MSQMYGGIQNSLYQGELDRQRRASASMQALMDISVIGHALGNLNHSAASQQQQSEPFLNRKLLLLTPRK